MDFPDFPFTAYSIQQGFMQSLYRACDEAGVALLESPTGTGKTLSVICGVLKWLEDHRAMESKNSQQPAQSATAQQDDDPDWLRTAASTRTALSVQPSLRGSTASTDLKGKSLEARKARAKARKLKGSQRNVMDFANQRVAFRGGSASQEAAPPAEDMFVLTDKDMQTTIPGIDDTSSEDDDPALEASLQAKQAKDPGKTQVIFCSRTHSQLSQFVSELKRTTFPERLSIVCLASRKVVCINKEVTQLEQSGMINQACLDMQQKLPSSAAAKRGRSKHNIGRCPYLKSKGPDLEQLQDDVSSEPMDVEDLVSLGRSLGVCPYYGSRSLVSQADVVACPFPSLLQEESRRALGLNLQGSILVLDEAHNLVDAVNSIHSVHVSGSQLTAAHDMLAAYFTKLGNRLSPRNAQHIQLLQRVLSVLSTALQGEGTGGSRRGHAHGRMDGLGSHAEDDSAAAVTTPNDFLFKHEIDDVNLFELLSWVQESNMLVKLASYSLWQVGNSNAQTSTISKSPTVPGSKVRPASLDQNSRQGSDKSRIHDTGSHAQSSSTRTARLSSLQACVSFLKSLTYANADGRILVVPQSSAARPHATTQQPLNHNEDGDGVTASTQCPAGATEAGGVGEECGSSSGYLKYILLNAATHFGKVLSECRSVIIASGTLSPVQGLVSQLFTGSGLRLLPTPIMQPLSQAAPQPPHQELVSPAGGVVAQESERLRAVGQGSGQKGVSRHNLSSTKITAAAVSTPSAPMRQLHLLGDLQRPYDTSQAHQAAKFIGIQRTIHAALPPPPAPPNATCDMQISDDAAGISRSAYGVTTTDNQCDVVGRPLYHYSCGHVIPADQLSVVVVGTGPSGVTLDMRHSTRSSPAIMDEVGRLLLNVCRVVPGGVVVFVPSFSYLNTLTQHLQRTGVVASIENKKVWFSEPRAAADVDNVLQQYSQAIQATSAAGGSTSTLAGNADQVGVAGGSQHRTGALLIAVVGGKLSEGINFGDDLGRCVVVLGLPYANPSDPELKSRMDHLDRMSDTQHCDNDVRNNGPADGGETCKTGPCRSTCHNSTADAVCNMTVGSFLKGQNLCQVPVNSRNQETLGSMTTSSVGSRPCGLTGRQLYENMCMNAVNQCVGRVVRHAKDYAAVILVDPRYMQQYKCNTNATSFAAVSSSSAAAQVAGGVGKQPDKGVSDRPIDRLPAWMTRSVHALRQDFPHCYQKLVQFFKTRTSKQ